MSDTIIAYGGTVERSADGVTYTAIPEVKGIAVPTITTEYPEVTNLDSPDGFREYIKGLKDPGEITLTCGYTPAGMTQQLADQALPDAAYYRVTLRPAPSQSTGDRFTFRGFPTPTPVDNGVGEPMDMSIQIRITGNVVRVAGAAA